MCRLLHLSPSNSFYLPISHKEEKAKTMGQNHLAAQERHLEIKGSILLWKKFEKVKILVCYKLSHSNAPSPKLYGEIDKKALFSNFLFFFTFFRETKKITFFVVRNLTKNCTLSLSHLKLTFSKFTFFTLCFKVRKWKQIYIYDKLKFWLFQIFPNQNRPLRHALF